MDIVQIVGIGLIATFLAIVVKEQKPVFAFTITVFTGAIIFLFLIGEIQHIIQMLEGLASKANIEIIYVETVLKIIGIAYIAEFGAQITRDAGQGAIASKIELAGKLLIMAMAIPILKLIIETVLQLLPS
ncbi:stage III sporulation protein AD [Guptibacillus algicola]|uniref:stage III sporulation protein AD n=1 Tax=Guptibacillus algicola TaxID=225844 RepID=UPI001CD62E0B|nr:stage III sporulation protein AD [Alkalihalobacillus algicola]MCA0985979.1 stage III sporulation protein AD [Alkalihalobacillus algicola]